MRKLAFEATMSMPIETTGTRNPGRKALAALIALALLAPGAALAGQGAEEDCNQGKTPGNCKHGDGPDFDGDSHCDWEDNCVEVFNPYQRDSNGDGFGNACDCDYNNDGVVGLADMGILALSYELDKNSGYNPDTDHNNNCKTDGDDLGAFQDAFGSTPGPSADAE